MTKLCPKCLEDKALDAFGVRRRSPSGRKSWCRACEAASQQQRYRERVIASACVRCGTATEAGRVICAACRGRDARSRANRKAEGVCRCGALVRSGHTRCADCLAIERRRYLSTRSGLSAHDYLELVRLQQGACAICGRNCATGRRLAVDYDHVTGRVRSLLCFRCNTSLARYEEYAREFAEYLSRTDYPITAHVGRAAARRPKAAVDARPRLQARDVRS